MPELPSFIGRYRVVERLSSGGMGVLYLARDPAIDRTVAIKVARVHNVALRQRFLREARATGRLNHRNIVTIHDVGEHDGEPFIAMEYVPGRTLAAIIHRRTRLPLLRRLRMLRELCDGLAYAHDQSIIHRDVKPSNLIAREDTGTLTILDFGIARLQDALTMTGGTAGGTPNYMAPEQIAGADVDHRCDVFAVGLVCYELLSYRRAFDGDTVTAVLYRITHEEPVRLPELVPDLDSDLVRIVERALAKQPKDRYQSLRDLLAELDTTIGRIEEQDGGRESVVPVPADEEPPGSPPEPSRSELVARRQEKLTSHLEAAHVAIEKELWDVAQAATERAALLDPDDDQVLRTFERISAGRRDQQLDDHLSIARGHLESLELTQAAESVESALQLQPQSPAVLQLRQEIQSRLTVNRHLERAEQGLASGEFTDALLSVHEALAVDEQHEAARTLKEHILTAARDHRAQAAVQDARAKRAAGDLAAALAILEGFAEAHDSVTAELATLRKEITHRRKSFEAFIAQARSHLEHGKLEDARDPMRKALDALDVREPARPSESGQAVVSALQPSRATGSPAPADDPVARPAGRNPPPELDVPGRRRKLFVAALALGSAAVVMTFAVASSTWLSSPGSSGREPGLAATRGTTTGGAEEPGARRSASGMGRSSAVATDPDSAGANQIDLRAAVRPDTAAGEHARPNPIPVAVPRAAGPSPTTGPDVPAPARTSSPRAPASSSSASPSRPDIDGMLADAEAAEVTGDVDAALDIYDAVLRRDAANRAALAGRERVQATKIEATVQENLRAGNAAFAAARYDEAGRLFQDAVELNASPVAAEGLRRVDNVKAVLCRDDAACGTLVIRVTPAAEIFVDERSLGTATELALPVSAGLHRVRLETAEWRFPRTLQLAAGETVEVTVDLEQDGFPK